MTIARTFEPTPLAQETRAALPATAGPSAATLAHLEKKTPETTPTFPPLESVTKPSLTTAEIAYYTNTRPQTWRQHACYETGPIRPIRILGKLNWPTAQCKKLLGFSA